MSERRRVFVVQTPMRRRDDGALEPRYDFSAAAEHGALSELIGSTAKPFRPQEFVPQLRERLADFGDRDSLLLVGSPVIIGIVVCLAAQASGGRVAMLQWSSGRYVRVEADLAPPGREWTEVWR